MGTGFLKWNRYGIMFMSLFVKIWISPYYNSCGSPYIEIGFWNPEFEFNGTAVWSSGIKTEIISLCVYIKSSFYKLPVGIKVFYVDNVLTSR